MTPKVRQFKNSYAWPYTKVVFVGITDQSIADDTQTLVPPYTYKLLHFGEPVGSGQTHSMIDSRQVSQVENVVELWGCGWKIFDNFAENRNILFII